jgi:type I restriction enzyme M protein
MLLQHFQPAMDWWRNREEISLDGFDKAKRYTAQELADGGYNLDLCGFPHEEEEILPPDVLIRQYKERRASLNSNMDRILAEIETLLNS